MCLAGLSSYSSSILTHTRVLRSEFLDLLITTDVAIATSIEQS